MSAHNPNKLCVLIPAYNEEQHIEQCLFETRAAFPSALIVVVDNNSQDNTAHLATQMGVVVISERAPGKGRAVCAGVQFALSAGCKWIALHDSDNEYNPQHLANLVQACLPDSSGNPVLVMGVGLREVPLGHVLWRSLLANYVARVALRVALKKRPPVDILTGARVLSADLARLLFAETAGGAPYKGFELETALTRKALKHGAHLVYAPVRYSPRSVTEKKIRAWDMFSIVKAALYA